ncbi:hypothetical protein EDD21DRAFT_411337 [Dissophora ornata]|nr:hypothetical protein BGZ58_000463 [Dissophora ornata]KAI8605185.1 hypothetical protein EDD21DRAFT_411337 [Dissophora ornata]
MQTPRGSLLQLVPLLLLLSLLAELQLTGHGLVEAQKRPSLFKRVFPGRENSAASKEALKQQQVIAGLKALSSSSNLPSADTEDLKKKRQSKGKDIENLFPRPSESQGNTGIGTGNSGVTKSKESTGHEDDIVHNFDHADNEAYDDIVWYDGPHRDDEDEHGHGDDHDDQEDDHHPDHEDEHDEHEDTAPKRVQRPLMSQTAEVLSNLNKLSGARSGGASSESGPGTQVVFADPHPSEHSDHPGQGSVEAFQHSGAEVLTGAISANEFCLRLKHECESACREFQSGVEHLSITCETGSVAELLFWGRCCQIGQARRTRKLAVKVQTDLEGQYVQWQRKRHQAQQGFERENLQAK